MIDDDQEMRKIALLRRRAELMALVESIDKELAVHTQRRGSVMGGREPVGRFQTLEVRD